MSVGRWSSRCRRWCASTRSPARATDRSSDQYQQALQDPVGGPDQRARPAHRRDTMRTILITGASSGFGLGVTVELAKRGWTVHAGVRNPAKRHAVDDALDRAGVPRGRVHVVELDVTSPESI